MKILILGDTHLTKDFDKEKYIKLSNVISSADRIILNGDFWDGYKISFDEFLNSEWNKLFPLLKQKKTIYLIGNHDEKIDDRTSLFSEICTDKYDLKVGDTKYHIEHGNLIAPTLEEHFTNSFFRKFLSSIGSLFERTGLLIIGDEFAKIQTHLNKKMKKWKHEHLEENDYLICGHSHLKEFSIKDKYVNGGTMTNNYFQYVEITPNNIELKEL